MSRYVVIVTWEDLDDGQTPLPEVLGPFRTSDAADEFRDRLRRRIDGLPAAPDGDRYVNAYVIRLQPPRIRGLIAAARDFLSGLV